MRKDSLRFAPLSLLIVLVLYPACRILSSFWDWSLRISYPTAFAGVAAAVFVLHVLYLKHRNRAFSKSEEILFCFLPVLSMVWSMYYVIANGAQNVIQYIPITVICICSFYLSGFGKRHRIIYICSRIISVPVVAVIMVFYIVAILMSDFGATDVLKSIDSPGGRYTLRIVEVDQGALGGDTLVEVNKNSVGFISVNPLFRLRRTLVKDDWGAGEKMDVRWIDECTVLIDGAVYEM